MGTLHDDDDDESTTSTQQDVEVENDKVETKEPEVEVIEDDGADERTASSNDESDSDERRPARTKESAAERRARAKLAKERDKKELDFQRRELARQDALIRELQQGQSVNRVTELDNRIATALNEVETFDKIKAAAITKHEGADAVQAERLGRQAEDRARQAQWEKQQIIEGSKRAVNAAPTYAPLAKEFLDANPWYNGNDDSNEETLIVKAIDTAVAKKYNPNDPAYWNELQKRVAARLPQHFQDDSNDDDDHQEEAPRKRGGPPVGGTSRGSNSSTTTQIRLSPERVQAMKEAGIWEDPVLRARMAKSYANYDKQNSRG